jgi:hypothetical protein
MIESGVGEEIHVSILLYLVGGWFLLNVLFAVGMYFRPKRKNATSVLSARVQAEPTGDVRRLRDPADSMQERAVVEADVRDHHRPVQLVRLLLFGLWFNDNRHSA